MNLKLTFYLTCLFALVSLGAWEIYWRSQGYITDLEDDKYLWADQRSRVEKADKNDVVIIGSSRALFDLQLDVWEEMTGIRPIQLASAGSTPLPAFKDLVQNTTFSGTIVVGVTEGLFFSTTFPGAPPWKRMQNRIEFYHNRTYAQRLNHAISIPLQQSFVFLMKDEEPWDDEINLKNLISKIDLGRRTQSPRMPPFNKFSDITLDRNVRMKEELVTDTAWANSIQRVWQAFTPEDRKSDISSTMSFFLSDAKTFMERGGNLILLRCPSNGKLREIEAKNLPRTEVWDELVRQSGAHAYHYEDYEPLQDLHLPEWSHLAPADADLFTKELLQIMLKDNVISTK